MQYVSQATWFESASEVRAPAAAQIVGTTGTPLESVHQEAAQLLG